MTNPIKDKFKKMLLEARIYSRPPRKIKITSSFDAYLHTVCPTIVEDSLRDEYLARGVCGQFTGIPIEIDDTIENEYYELVYEEKKKND